MRRALATTIAVVVAASSRSALADAAPTTDAPPDTGPLAREAPADDPTGGAYTTPTLHFVPAAAVPTWNVRVITSLDVQGPTAPDRLASGTAVGFQPGLGGEVGLPFGVTFAGGTNWVGGDTSPTPISGGLSPYFQLRYQLYGRKDGRGFLLGASTTYKFVGFQGDPGELELAVSAQYRRRYYEVGLQGVFGKDFATTDSDAEVHAYAAVRPVQQLALGGVSQVRVAIQAQPKEPPADLIAGGLASLTLWRWQVAALGGTSTVGLNENTQVRFGALGEVFGTVRF